MTLRDIASSALPRLTYSARHNTTGRSIARLTLRDVVLNDIARHHIALHRNA
ncbi:hypothetical protein [Bartonella apihabitans]|uniref:hypothetical protein n=1 Tax=Bartonella apihabitans TaxID=2750929 RepID=UPI003BB711AE